MKLKETATPLISCVPISKKINETPERNMRFHFDYLKKKNAKFPKRNLEGLRIDWNR